MAEGRAQLLSYLQGGRRAFSLPLAPAGTPFQQAVWAQLARIPYGSTLTYGQLAARVGNPKAVRAVGQANHRNPPADFDPLPPGGGKGGRPHRLRRGRGPEAGASGAGGDCVPRAVDKFYREDRCYGKERPFSSNL